MDRRVGNAYGPPAVDAAPGTSPQSAIAVHMLTSAAKDLVEGAFPPLWVRGEIADFKAHRNGHWYFTLRDDDAQMKCVVWSSQQRRMPVPPEDGIQVVVLGQMTVWPGRGDLQFSVKVLTAEGDGLWQKALERTRRRLAKDGLLDPARKRALPRFPRRVALITSPNGAALHDVITVTKARSSDVEVVLIPAQVQGDDAPASLIEALSLLERWGGADVLIIGRGGGGREDLWAFNNEHVARALAACAVPTISAVGHEVDITICDLVADVRAATPSAAAELAVPSRKEVVATLAALGARLSTAARRREERAATALSNLRARLSLTSRRLTERRRAQLESLAGKLDSLSPLSTLSRGFAVARSPSGATMGSRRQFVVDAPFDLWLRDGIVSAVASTSRDLPDARNTLDENAHEL